MEPHQDGPPAPAAGPSWTPTAAVPGMQTAPAPPTIPQQAGPGPYPGHPSYPSYPSYPNDPGYPRPGIAPAGAGPFPRAPKARRTGLIVVLSVLAAFVGLVVVGTIAAVVVPVLLNQRQESTWASTTVTLPESVLGLTRQPGGVDLGELAPGLPSGVQTGVYADGTSLDTTGPTVVVLAYRFPVRQSTAQQAATLAGVERGVTRDGSGIAFAERPAGRLGGTTRCGIGDSESICVSVDDASLVIVVASADVPGGLDAVASVRTQVEHRA